VDELAEWIEPPPGITDVRYVPTSGEAQAIAGFLSGVPTGAVASWREGVDGDAVARQTEERQTEYWLVSSRVPLDSIMGLHRANAAARAWRAGTDEPRWMILHRAGDVLSVFATDAWPESGTDILYALTRADGKGRDRTDKTGGDAGPG